jgi:hypothetical protein
VHLLHVCRWSNQGYCGETSLIQSGMGYGQWISQFNARAIATPFGITMTQTGAANGQASKYLSQILLEYPTTGNSFGTAASNFKLAATRYNSGQQATGLTVRLEAIRSYATGTDRIDLWDQWNCSSAPPTFIYFITFTIVQQH